MVNNDFHNLKEKLSQLDKETSIYLKELKQLLLMKDLDRTPSVIGYFTHSVNVTHSLSEPNFILGNLKIENIGQIPIHNLIVCLNMTISCSYDLSGKYILDEQPTGISMPYFWQLVEQKEHEYWFKLVNKETLAPSETITFSDFMINWKSEESYTCGVRGFIYCEELQEGLTVINPINLSRKISS